MKVKIYNSSIGIIAEFKVHFVAHLTCVRCLRTIPKEFNANQHIVYIKGKDPLVKTERMKLKSFDIDKIYYNGSHIDLSLGIREVIVLFLPVAPLCEDDCRGLCPVCGANRNIIKCGCSLEKVGLFTPSIPKKIDKRKRGKKK